MKSAIVRRSIVVGGHKTSISLEDGFWRGLKEIARTRHLALSSLVSAIDIGRVQPNLSSAIRLFVLDYYRAQTAGDRLDWREPQGASTKPGADAIGTTHDTAR